MRFNGIVGVFFYEVTTCTRPTSGIHPRYLGQGLNQGEIQIPREELEDPKRGFEIPGITWKLAPAPQSASTPLGTYRKVCTYTRRLDGINWRTESAKLESTLEILETLRGIATLCGGRGSCLMDLKGVGASNLEQGNIEIGEQAGGGGCYAATDKH